MGIIPIILIAFGLAMDAFAVSITSGLTIKRKKINQALRIATFFGLFQAIMPVIGWLAGLSLRELISGFDHWIAFGLLIIIGGKMIFESTRTKGRNRESKPLTTPMLFMLAIATSIDALAVGLSLSLLEIWIIMPALIIGAITFMLSFTGVFIGNRLGHFFGRKIEAAGGLILIGIGIKILIEHSG
ncbi:MAG: manganese efflux pump MntP family protein [bacterium]